jgi:hypothetical protein
MRGLEVGSGKWEVGGGELELTATGHGPWNMNHDEGDCQIWWLAGFALATHKPWSNAIR